MRLALFDLIDETIQLRQMNEATYQYTQGQLVRLFEELTQDKSSMLGVSSRIKACESLREKMLRNKYYLKCESAQDVLNQLPDLIGLTLECRFISDESDLYKSLFDCFKPMENSPFYQCAHRPQVYLNLRMPQPQLQRNGYTIYRMDGYFEFNEHKINFELQIKSLVHDFWGEVEHQLVYKNTEFRAYDFIVKELLGSIRDNLEVVDKQLEIMNQQLTRESHEKVVGMDENTFKIFIAQNINNLVAIKMNQSVGIVSDFRKCSAILTQFIYIQDFINSGNPQLRMIEYFDHFKFLEDSDLDFTAPIELEKDFVHEDVFCHELGQYWQKIINADFEWHVFFMMLFAVQPGNNIQDFTNFIELIRNLIFPVNWYKELKLSDELKAEIKRDVAQTLVRYGKIEMVYEEKLLHLLNHVRELCEAMELMGDDYSEKELLLKKLRIEILNLF